MLILKALSLEPMHGWGISQRLQQLSRDVLQINQGTLYPALHRMEAAGWVVAEWRASDHNRRAKFYSLTASGKRQLAAERRNWAVFAAAVEQVMGKA
jgi:transcriptional regulator